MRLRSRERPLAAVILLLLTATGVPACGRSNVSPPTHSAGGTTTALAATGSPSPPMSATGIVYPAFPDVPRGSEKALTFREYRLRGKWIVRDYDDGVCALDEERIVYPEDRLFLLDIASGRSRCVLSRPVNVAKHYNLMEAKVNSRWVAWVELSPGDDLVAAATWRLYVARLNKATLRLGKPRLVDGDTTKRTTRPMFALSGDTLVWRVNGQRDPQRPGLVYAADLGAKGPVAGHAIWRTKSILITLGATRDRVYALERTSTGALPHRLLVAPLSRPNDTFSFELKNDTDVAGYPAVNGDWAAWSLFINEEDMSSGLLYVRQPNGRVRFVASLSAVAPCFAGDRLFYSDIGREGGGPARSRICMVDLSRMTWSVVQQVDSNTAGTLYTAYAAPAAEHTLVTYRTTPDFANTIVRVYHVD
jgi:hypothetical protein